MSQVQKDPTFFSDVPPKDQERTEYDQWLRILISIFVFFFLLKPSSVQIPVNVDFEQTGKRKWNLKVFIFLL